VFLEVYAMLACRGCNYSSYITFFKNHFKIVFSSSIIISFSPILSGKTLKIIESYSINRLITIFHSDRIGPIIDYKKVMEDIGLLEIDCQFWYYGTISWIDHLTYLLVNDASLLHKTQWLTNAIPIGIVIKLIIILMF
jgi:hypothetical protein